MSIRSLTVLAATGYLFACGATTSNAGGDGGSGGKYTPQATVTSQVQPGSESGVNDASQCGMDVPLAFSLGAAGQLVQDNTETGGTVSLTCSVVPRDDGGFDVNAHVTSDQGGFTIFGRVSDGPNNSVLGSIGTKAGAGATTIWWDDPNCVFATTTQASPGVAAGRIWGTLTCLHSTAEKTTRVCAASAEVRFEDCYDKN